MGYNDLGRLRIIRWARSRNLPTYIWGDSNILGDRPTVGRRIAKRRLLAWITKRVNGFLVCGELGRQFFVKYGARSHNIFACPPESAYADIQDIGDETARDVVAEYGVGSARRMILVNGRLAPEKRPDLALEAFCRIAANRPEWNIVFVGDGPLGDSLRASVPADLLERVHFAGFVSDPKHVAAFYRRSDLLLLASDADAWGIVVAEAASAGLALVTSNVVGAAKELVRDNVNGTIFAAGDLIELVKSLEWATSESNIDRLRLHSGNVFAGWREVSDPIRGLRAAIEHVGVVISAKD
jgi:glycosyltransferase involved in cell wall biosynthesis